MSATRLSQPYGVLTDATTLQLQRHLPGPVERVWAYLTDSDLRQKWLAAGCMTLTPGTPFELVWRNDDLSASPDERPEGFAEESHATCTLTEVDPLRKLRFEWPGVGEVTFELRPSGDEVLLTITHRQLANRDMTLMVGAGWHMHLDILIAHLDELDPPSFWHGWRQLREAYARQLPA
jgi:uncharacterized protein YndB with AHSA1/START domain